MTQKQKPRPPIGSKTTPPTQCLTCQFLAYCSTHEHTCHNLNPKKKARRATSTAGQPTLFESYPTNQ
jgi:hypothetical protein